MKNILIVFLLLISSAGTFLFFSNKSIRTSSVDGTFGYFVKKIDEAASGLPEGNWLFEKISPALNENLGACNANKPNIGVSTHEGKVEVEKLSFFPFYRPLFFNVQNESATAVRCMDSNGNIMQLDMFQGAGIIFSRHFNGPIEIQLFRSSLNGKSEKLDLLVSGMFGLMRLQSNGPIVFNLIENAEDGNLNIGVAAGELEANLVQANLDINKKWRTYFLVENGYLKFGGREKVGPNGFGMLTQGSYVYHKN